MEKYYKYNQGRRTKVFFKITERTPNPFKKFKKKFLSIEECTISLLGQYKVHIGTGAIDQSQLDRTIQLNKAEEISEQEYNDALIIINILKQEITRIFKEL